MPTDTKAVTKSWYIIIAVLAIIGTAQASDIYVTQTLDNPDVKVERDPALITQNPSTDTTTAEPTQYCSVISGCTDSK